MRLVTWESVPKLLFLLSGKGLLHSDHRSKQSKMHLVVETESLMANIGGSHLCPSHSHKLAPVAVLPAGKGSFKLYFLIFPREGLLPPSALFPSVFCRLSCWAFNFPLV